MTKGGSVVVETLASTKAIICAPSLLIDDFVEEKEFIVLPYKTKLYLVATTVIPVAKAESVFLKLSLLTFFINFFVKK